MLPYAAPVERSALEKIEKLKREKPDDSDDGASTFTRSATREHEDRPSSARRWIERGEDEWRIARSTSSQASKSRSHRDDDMETDRDRFTQVKSIVYRKAPMQALAGPSKDMLPIRVSSALMAHYGRSQPSSARNCDSAVIRQDSIVEQ